MITGISAVRNEEKRILGMIKSLQRVCNQVIIIDGGSTDKTVEIAELMGCEVYQGDNTQYGEYARRLAIPHVKNNWVLILDADERLTPHFIRYAKSYAQTGKKGFMIPEGLVLAGELRCVERRFRFMHKDHVDFIDLLHSPPMPKNMTDEDMGYVSELCIKHEKSWIETIWGEERYERQAIEMNRPEVDRLNFHLHLLREKGITAEEADRMSLKQRIRAGIGYDPKLYEILEDKV